MHDTETKIISICVVLTIPLISIAGFTNNHTRNRRA